MKDGKSFLLYSNSCVLQSSQERYSSAIKWEVKKKNSKFISDISHFLFSSKNAECETNLDPKLIIGGYKNNYTYEVLKNRNRRK
uniref:Uncharacterized protein n=1 Tax=Strongyloides venezuelensis TaxID=75913 RepID=A0A0K0FRW4_STRVS